MAAHVYSRSFAARMPDWVLSVFTLLFFIFMIAPIAVVVAASFTSVSYVSFPPVGFSLKWFGKVWDYKPFVDSFIVSLEVAFGSAIIGAILAIPAALHLARSRSAFAGAISSFMLSPLSLPAIVLGFSLLFYLSAIGVPLSITSLLIAHTVVTVPYIMRSVIGIYRSVSPSYEEAAAVLGAGSMQTFWHVTLPMIRPGVFAGALFAILISIDNLPLSFFFSSVNTNTLPVVVLSYLENQFDPAIAAISTIQLLFAILLLVIMERMYGLRRMALSM
ncbi:ABC transporter permease [Martelella sp. HB161492]|uniref:ABC transporter permease n=1 Tax=Martelella sp. HB161492 TaxID=2720726 RepID=UPI001FEFE827|nr:ABC transporter permease [Martelella sp. HB161492]